MEKNNIPKNWGLVKIDDISNVVRGASPRPAGSPKYFGGKIPWITVGCLTSDSTPYMTSVSEYLNEEGKKKSRFIPSNTLLITNSGATLGVPKITKIGGCINDGVVAILDVEKPLKKYLYYFLSNQTKSLRRINQGAAQPNLNTQIIKSLEFPLPPLNEQKRIVEKIEEFSALIDFIKTVLKKTKNIQNDFRQSLLKSAFTGNLTKKWRIVNNVKLNFKEELLENLILFSKNGFTGRPNEMSKGIPRLGIETITQTNSIYVNETKHKFIEIPSSKIENYMAKKGDLFVCRQNGNKNYVGKSAVFDDLINPMIFSDSLIQLRPKKKMIIPEYLAFFINSKLGRNQIERYCSTTAGNYSINGTNLKKTIISFPSFSEQKEIVSVIKEWFSIIENNNKIIYSLLTNIEVLQNVILKQAFEGKLIPQDPKDEPASELLKRIKLKN